MGIRATDVIQPGETAIVIFTHGDNFVHDLKVGDGESGNWKISTDSLEFVNRVIIYLRKHRENKNRVFLGDYSGYRKSEEPGRLIVRFNALIEIEETDLNWIEFSEGSQNPVQIISK
jgi:hypothetical protein